MGGWPCLFWLIHQESKDYLSIFRYYFSIFLDYFSIKTSFPVRPNPGGGVWGGGFFLLEDYFSIKYYISVRPNPGGGVWGGGPGEGCGCHQRCCREGGSRGAHAHTHRLYGVHAGEWCWFLIQLINFFSNLFS